MVVGLALNLLLDNRLMADANTLLENRSGALLATLDTSGSRLRVIEGANDAVLDEQAWVFDGQGRAIERPPINDETRDVATSLARVSAQTERTIEDQAKLLAVPVMAGGQQVGTVVVGASLGPYERTKHLAAFGTLILCGFVGGVGVLLARRAVGMALRPVADMTTQAGEWSVHDVDRRFGLGEPRDELTALAATLDGLLGRSAAALRHEQRFSAEMAHELRTPLSGVRGEAELALAHAASDTELREALERVLAGTDRMAAVIDTLLVAARREGAGPLGSSDAAALVRALAAEPAMRVQAPREPVPVGADQQLVAAALHPLLENAV
ncbi:MAG TPA: histidine kinase dimerization/phospho-acceptor domain-containing protein, partial [Polyangiaceae bacterium]|nr:histidine kinase dimerization/phospho-acceptor domain-containing protein [Polyangiaceae bacterium]